MFEKGKSDSRGKSAHNRGNQHTRDPDLAITKIGLQKRMSGRLSSALAAAPQHAKDKWDAICGLKGKRGASIFWHKKEFMMKLVSDPQWESILDSLGFRV